MFRIAIPIELSRFVGMTFPGKHAGPPVVALQAPGSDGSLMLMGRPLVSTLCEKLPIRSSSVGTVMRVTFLGSYVFQSSRLTKKNHLLPTRPAGPTGPPSVPLPARYLKIGFGRLLRMLK